MNDRYTTIADIEAHVVIPSIEGGDATRDEYNTDEIAHAVAIPHTSPEGDYYFTVVDTDEFWKIVAMHHIGDNN